MRHLSVKISIAAATVLTAAGILTACGGDKDAATPAPTPTTSGATTGESSSDTTTTGGTPTTEAWCAALGEGDDLKAAIALGAPDDMPADAKKGLEFLAEHEDEWENIDTMDPALMTSHYTEIIALSGYMLSACVPDMESMMSDLGSAMSDLPTDINTEDLASMLSEMATP